MERRKLFSALSLLILFLLASPSLVQAVPCSNVNSDVTTIAAGALHSVGLKENGTVVATGDNSMGQSNVSSWTNIKAIAAGLHTVGLKEDGTVVTAWGGAIDVSSWTNIKAIAAGYNHTVGLKEDGTVVAVGYSEYSGSNIYGEYNVSSWTNIKGIAAGSNFTVGLKEDGTVVAVGDNKWGQLDVSSWTNITAIAAGRLSTVGLKADGTVVAAGFINRIQNMLSSWTNVIAISAGEYHVVGLKGDGTVVAAGWNQWGQMDVSSWENIAAISAGLYHTVGLKEDGTAVAAGWNRYGESSVSSWKNIMQPVCGTLDTTPPVTSADINGTAGNNGWYVTDTDVSLTSLDADSDVKEIHYTLAGVEAIVSGPSASFSINTEGEHAVGYYAIDKADNTETANSLTVKIDKTAPAITVSSTPVPNANGWNNSDVTITYACNDALSGIFSCQSPVSVVSEGARQVFTGTAEDFSGLEATATAMVNLDKTAPVITALINSSSNGNGWHNADVTVTFVCSDRLSGIASCPDPVIVTTEGANQVITGTAVDKAGNTAVAQVMLNIDKTMPAIAATVSPPPNANGCNNSDVTVTFVCSDSLSGMVSCPAPVTVSAEGAGQVISGTALDSAGNTATTTVTLNIDKITPEAVIRFDAPSQDIKVYNSETGAEAGYIVLPSVANKEEGEFDDDDDKDDDDGHHERQEAHGKELRQYTLQDCANNTLVLILRHKQEGNEAKIKVVSMEYNGGAVMPAPRNKMEAETSTDKGGALKELEQKIEVRPLIEVSAKYSGKKGETSLSVEEAGQRDKKTTMPGMALLELLTVKGALNYRY